MVVGFGLSMTSASAAAVMLLSPRFCRFPLPAACISASPISSLPSSSSCSLPSNSSSALLSSSAPLSSSSCDRPQSTFLILNSSSCPALPGPALFPLFSKSLLVSRVRMDKLGSLGSGSFSSSATGVATTPEDVLEFWFKGVGPESGVYMRKQWFFGGPEFDAECEEKCGECLKLFSTGALDGWMKTIRGRLALVIILDQISRNLYRISSSSYAQDPSALKITLDTIEKGWDKQLPPSERQFLYMPLSHSENLEYHEIVDRLFEDLATETSDNEKLHEQMIIILENERKHSVVLKRFGRYPSRNAVLGRPNTTEEEEFLASGPGW